MNSVVSPSSVDSQWTSVCAETDLIPDAGVCVLFEGEQIAIFKADKSGDVFAISNFDPISKANVLSRGIVGSIKDRLVVASPLYKQHFCLNTGECLEQDCKVDIYPVRIMDGEVQLAAKQ